MVIVLKKLSSLLSSLLSQTLAIVIIKAVKSFNNFSDSVFQFINAYQEPFYLWLFIFWVSLHHPLRLKHCMHCLLQVLVELCLVGRHYWELLARFFFLHMHPFYWVALGKTHLVKKNVRNLTCLQLEMVALALVHVNPAKTISTMWFKHW